MKKQKEITPNYSPIRDGSAKKRLQTIICDIDGTLALKGNRGIYDFSRCGEDLPNFPVVFFVKHLSLFSTIVLISGRKEICRWQTEMWLAAQEINFHALFMRKDNDNRPDHEVKHEIYENNIKGTYFNILGAIDDRPSIVRLWQSLGIFTFDVNNGKEEF